MKQWRNSLFYLTVIGGFSALIYWTLLQGSKLTHLRTQVLTNPQQSAQSNLAETLSQNLAHPLAILLGQIVTIICVARFLSWICKKIGQPAVIGEIIAGIILGPSLLGMYFPTISATLFPPESLGNLQFLSQIGLILFMFVVGMELDLKVLKNIAHEAVVISHASIIIPFTLGLGLAYYMFTSFAPAGVQFVSFGLFLGIAMSITAFPVLARIVQERGLQKTKLGTMVITCAAADDLTAWCILAAVIAIVKAESISSTWYILGMACTYVLLMIYLVRPFLKRVGELHASRENLSKSIVAIFFLTLIISSLISEVIGIHALFGAFMAGTIMPDNAKFRQLIIEKVEDVALVLLLPLFFVFTGLRTQIGLLSDPYLWKVTGVIVLVAVVGKFVGSALAAKFVGQNWKNSLIIGALMNTRGLMELVVLNIGYDLGVLTPEIFAMMVLMALITTFMTGTALDFINWIFRADTPESMVPVQAGRQFNILIFFSNPLQGKALLRIAAGITHRNKEQSTVTSMHLSPSSEMHHYDIEQHELESFAPIIQESEVLQQPILTFYKVSNDIDADVVEMANKGRYDLLLIGVGQSIFEGSLLGKILGFTTRLINPEKIINQVIGKESLFENSPFDERTQNILQKSTATVGILVDKGFKKLQHLVIPIFGSNDLILLETVQQWLLPADLKITVLNTVKEDTLKAQLASKLNAPKAARPMQVINLAASKFDREKFQEEDLVLLTTETWKYLIEQKTNWLSDLPSTLLISRKPKIELT